MVDKMSLVVIYLAAPRSVGKFKDWTRIDCLEASLKLLKIHVPKLPIVIFNEDYDNNDKSRLLSVINDIQFETVDFSGHEKYYVNRRPNTRVGTYGYCMMCRFFSGQVQLHPSIQQYTHYMRLDDDSYILEPLTDKTINEFTSYDYVHRCNSHEEHEELYNHTVEFMKQEKLPILSKYATYVPYNNFHVSSIKLWRHPIINRYINSIESKHGWTNLGWTDAPIHKMIISLLCPALGIKTSTVDFAYRHNQHCSHTGQHNIYCKDHLGGSLSWGPPACIEGR
jgi:hypothetical protein